MGQGEHIVSAGIVTIPCEVLGGLQRKEESCIDI